MVMLLKPLPRDQDLLRNLSGLFLGALQAPLTEQLPTALPAGGHQSQRKPRFSSGTGKVAFNSQVPCSFLSKDSTLSRTLLTWNSEGWVCVPQISPGTSLAEYGKVIPKEVLNLRQHTES